MLLGRLDILVINDVVLNLHTNTEEHIGNKNNNSINNYEKS